MSKHLNSWSETEIENILQHFQQHGITATVRHFKVASSLIHRWQSMKGKPYAVVKDKDGKIVDNETVVKIIEQLIVNPFAAKIPL